MLLTAAYCFLVSLELPELEPELLPEPMPLLGDVVEPPLLGDVVELPLLEPLVPPAAPEPDLLKCASHSEREIWPSLFVSTDEKLGAELLAPALLDGLLLEPLLDGLLLEPDAALPPEDDVPDDPLDIPDEPLELEPDAAGEDEDLSLLVLLEELWAMAALESAKSAAATAALSTLRFNIG